jgi:probable DNA metabolism protein
MNTFLYDGSFFGLLTALSHITEQNIGASDIKTQANYKGDLFSEPIIIETDTRKAEAFISKLSKISPDFNRTILFSYHSEIKDIEIKLLNFIRFALNKRKFPTDYTNPDINFILQTTRKVGLEIHRFKGLLRFREMEDNTLFAPIAPDHNIIFFLAKHFSSRIANEKWIIFDTKRHIVLEWDTEQISIYIDKERRFIPKNYAENEQEIQTLWQAYFKEIAIQNRKNPRLQKQFMPQRYWKYLTELHFAMF